MTLSKASDPMNVLVAMRAAGEISADEFKLAKKYLLEELAAGSQPPAPPRKSGFGWGSVVLSLVGFSVLLSMCGGGNGQPEIARNGLSDRSHRVHQHFRGEDWPFPRFAYGDLRCATVAGRETDPAGFMVLIDLGGQLYALNGTALGSGIYPDPRHMIPRGSFGEYRGKIPTVLNDYISHGLTLCR